MNSKRHRTFVNPTHSLDDLLKYRSLTQKEAAIELGISDCTMTRYISFYGIKGIFVKNYKGDDITKKEMLAVTGMTIPEQAKALGVSRVIVQKLRKRFNIKGFDASAKMAKGIEVCLKKAKKKQAEIKPSRYNSDDDVILFREVEYTCMIEGCDKTFKKEISFDVSDKRAANLKFMCWTCGEYRSEENYFEISQQ